MLVTCTVLAGTSCSLRPDQLPSIKGGVGNGYDVTLQFASTMNLPGGADVMMDGLRVGEVRKVELSGQGVNVSVRLEAGTQVPSDIEAVIQQNTVLGDTYIALDRNPAELPSGLLAEGGIVPVNRTTSPPQLEDTMAVLAYFVNGGSIQKAEDAINRVNAVMPAVNDVRRLASTVAVDMHDLGDNTAVLDRSLAGIGATARSINDNSAPLTAMFSDSGMHYWKRLNENVLGYVGTLLPSLGSIFEGGMWMVPMLDSLANTAGIGRGIWDAAPSDAQKLSTFLRSTILPFLHNPSVDVLSVESADGNQLIGNIEDVLRMLGAVR
ncbi:MCE family protein [Nocardia nova]|nr:MCE family protein [Nocardia nova]